MDWSCKILVHRTMSNSLLNRGYTEEWSKYCSGYHPYSIPLNHEILEGREEYDEFGFRMLININDTSYFSIFNGGSDTHIAFYTLQSYSDTVIKQFSTYLNLILSILKERGHTSFTFVEGSYELGLPFFVKNGMTWYEKFCGFTTFSEAYRKLKQIRIVYFI